MSKKKKNGNNAVSNGNGKCNGNGIEGNGNGSHENEKKIYTKCPVFITAKSENQKLLLKSIKENTITIVAGPPGSGKTMISVISGLREFIMGHYDKMIFTRPCVEANGENLGFLPGDLNEKIHPYMIPIMDFLSDFLNQAKIEALVKSGDFVTLPLAFQRGITFRNSIVILDEAQNTKPEQIRMFLTRIGENCKVIITGDPNQSDIKQKNGLVDALERLEGVSSLGIVRFGKEDIVRNPIIEEIEKRYEDMNEKYKK